MSNMVMIPREVVDIISRRTDHAKKMMEFIEEVAMKPYDDSDPVSLLATLRSRALTILEEINKNEKK